MAALALALVFAVLDWVAVARNSRRGECVFKPAALIMMIVGTALLMRVPHDGWQAGFFLSGLGFSLVGDVLLMLPERQRFFLPGLGAFVMAHLCYIVGLNRTLPPAQTWGFAALMAFIGVWYYRRLARGLQRQGQDSLRLPVALYAVILGAMAVSAWATLFRPEWTALRRGFAVAGATLFVLSDSLLGWERFIGAPPGSRVWVMITYHLGQWGLAASIALWGG